MKEESTDLTISNLELGLTISISLTKESTLFAPLMLPLKNIPRLTVGFIHLFFFDSVEKCLNMTNLNQNKQKKITS